MEGSERADRELLDTLAVCGDLVPVGSVYRFLAEHRLELFPDGLFAGLLGVVAGEDVEEDPEVPGRWRIAPAVAADRTISTVDPQARHARKSRSARRDGYKAHISAEPDTGLICATALTAANVSDAAAGPELLAAGWATTIKPIERAPRIPWLATRAAAVNLTRLINLGVTHHTSHVCSHPQRAICPLAHLTPGG